MTPSRNAASSPRSRTPRADAGTAGAGPKTCCSFFGGLGTSGRIDVGWAASGEAAGGGRDALGLGGGEACQQIEREDHAILLESPSPRSDELAVDDNDVWDERVSTCDCRRIAEALRDGAAVSVTDEVLVIVGE